MTLQSVKLVSESICLLLVGGSAVYAVRDLHQTQVEARGTVQALNASLAIVNRPCSPGPCGTLAEINKSSVKLQDVTVTLQRQVAESSKLVNETAASLTTASANVTETSQAIVRTADQATKLTVALTDDATAAKTSLDAFPPLLRQSTQAVAHLDAFLQSPDLTGTIANVNGTTRNMAAVSADAKKVADDATRRYFKPTPWYRKIVPYATAGAKIASYALPW